MTDESNSMMILPLARESDGLLRKFVTGIESCDPTSTSELSLRSMARIAKDWQDRFNAWSSYLGVFAEENISLDRRLDNNPDIRRMIIKLLEVLNLNLKTVVKAQADRAFSRERYGVQDLSLNGGFLSSSQEQQQFVEGSIDRLHRLGVTIRRSSMASLRSRVDAFAAKSNSPIEELCSKAIKCLYPLAPESLQEHLLQSILHRHFTLVYRKEHQNQISRRRSPSIQESDDEESAKNETTEAAPVAKVVPTANKAPTAGPDEVACSKDNSQSGTKPSTLKTDEFRRNIQAIPGPAFSVVSSAPAGNLLYPKPPEGKEGERFVSCSWCFEPLPASDCKEARKQKSHWWRRHVDRDLKPYVCLAESCAKLSPAFDRRSVWRAHMIENHSPSWAQVIHREPKWTCNIGHSTPPEFSTKHDFELHMHKEHGDSFTARQIASIIRRRSGHAVRSEGICPFRCSYDATQDPSVNSPSARHKATSELPLSETLHGSHKRQKPEKHGQPKRLRRVQFAEETFKRDDLDNSDDSTDKEPKRPNHIDEKPLQRALSRHIAAHLISLSFLTLRLKKLQEQNMGHTQEDDSSTGQLGSDMDDTSNLTGHSRHDSDFDAISLNFEDPDLVGDDVVAATPPSEASMPIHSDFSQVFTTPSPPHDLDPLKFDFTEEKTVNPSVAEVSAPAILGYSHDDVFSDIPHRDADTSSAGATCGPGPVVGSEPEWLQFPARTPEMVETLYELPSTLSTIDHDLLGIYQPETDNKIEGEVDFTDGTLGTNRGK